MTPDIEMDQDAFDAAITLIPRTGARGLEIGYLHDDVPTEKAGWYAHAQYQGTRITAENHPGPVEAVEALARRLLTGGQCTHCKGTITLSKPPKPKPGKWCRWTRHGDRWERGCASTIPQKGTR
ncbi:hypothetical protein [Nocardia salmonicida]|uniref:hypothetical protein n=1 Tax=Nocardia salmonicida TaxID=53431 RepID=UPI002E28558A|nr:hypothetical protein [Nocardia salmonicida]